MTQKSSFLSCKSVTYLLFIGILFIGGCGGCGGCGTGHNNSSNVPPRTPSDDPKQEQPTPTPTPKEPDPDQPPAPKQEIDPSTIAEGERADMDVKSGDSDLVVSPYHKPDLLLFYKLNPEHTELVGSPKYAMVVNDPDDYVKTCFVKDFQGDMFTIDSRAKGYSDSGASFPLDVFFSLKDKQDFLIKYGIFDKQIKASWNTGNLGENRGDSYTIAPATASAVYIRSGFPQGATATRPSNGDYNRLLLHYVEDDAWVLYFTYKPDKDAETGYVTGYVDVTYYMKSDYEYLKEFRGDGYQTPVMGQSVNGAPDVVIDSDGNHVVTFRFKRTNDEGVKITKEYRVRTKGAPKDVYNINPEFEALPK